MTLETLIYITLAVITVVILGYLFYSWRLRRQVSAKRKGIQLSKTKSRGFTITSTSWLRLYHLLDKNVLVRQSIRKLYIQFTELGMFNQLEARIQAIKLFMTSMIIMVGFTLFGLIAFGDLFMGILLLTVSIVIRDVFIKKRLDKYYYKMINQLGDAISEIRQAYLRTNSVVECLQEIQVGNLLIRQFATILEILQSEDAEERLEEFYASTPIKIIQTLAGICYAIENGGDTILMDGTSNFINSLSYITDEINLEIRRIHMQNEKFRMLQYLPLFPIIAMPFLAGFFINMIPATYSIYNGTFGYMTRIIIVFSSLICYMIISRVNSAMVVDFDDRPKVLQRLLHEKKWRKFVKIIVPTNPKVLSKKLGVIRNALSRLNLELLYFKKASIAAGIFLLTIILIVTALLLGISNEKKDMSPLTLTSSVDIYNEEEKEALARTDRDIMSKEYIPTEEEIFASIKESVPQKNDRVIQEEVDRVIRKYESLSSKGFKFWHLWVALFAALIGWNVPEFQLKFRQWLMKIESEEDCLQLQTIVSIMMNTSIDTLELLDWLAKHSRVHQHILIDALHEYPSDPELALMKLKQRSHVVEFRRLVDKLIITIHQISLAEAFAGLTQERSHLMRMREISQNRVIESKRAMVSPIAIIPTFLVIIFNFIAPIFIVGASEFIKVFQELNM